MVNFLSPPDAYNFIISLKANKLQSHLYPVLSPRQLAKAPPNPHKVRRLHTTTITHNNNVCSCWAACLLAKVFELILNILLCLSILLYAYVSLLAVLWREKWTIPGSCPLSIHYFLFFFFRNKILQTSLKHNILITLLSQSKLF